MKKIIFIITLAIIPMLAKSQNVGINTDTPDPSAVLDIYAQNKGFLGPVVALTARNEKAPMRGLSPGDADVPVGMMVYNTTVLAGNVDTELIKSYYYWNGSSWTAINTGYNNNVVTGQDISNFQTLGYVPAGFASSPLEINGPVSDGLSNKYTRLGTCYKWTTGVNANGHTYCAYKIGVSPKIPSDDSDKNQNATWANAYNAAKAFGGYLPTITTAEEWTIIKDNILEKQVAVIGSTTYKVKDYTAWIGMNKVTYAGNAKEFVWITGEKSSKLGNSAIPFGPFNGGEPNDTGSAEGCVHILSTTVSTSNQWNDLSCTATYSGRFGVLLVEFD